jgi:hypothetical protein
MGKLKNSKKVDLMPISVKRPRSRFNWRKKLAELVNTVEESESRFLELGDLGDVPADFIELIYGPKASKIRLRGTKIFMRGIQSIVHRACAI